MTSVAITNLPAATGLNTSDIVPVVQSGVTKKTTAGDVITTMTGFTQTGVGAVARTPLSKMHDILALADFSSQANFDTAADSAAAPVSPSAPTMRIPGHLSVGVGTSAQSVQPFEVINTDAGISLTVTGGTTSNEGYVAAFSKNNAS